MPNLNRPLNKIASTLSEAWGGINRSSQGIRAKVVSSGVVDSTKGIAAGAYSNAKATALDVVSRSGIRSGRGYGIVGGGAALGAAAGGYNAYSNRDSIGMGIAKGALGGAGLAAGGLLGGGAYKSARSGLLGKNARAGYAGAKSMGMNAWSKTAGMRTKIGNEFRSRAEAGSQMSLNFNPSAGPAQGNLF
jgi:hypothetical protein